MEIEDVNLFIVTVNSKVMGGVYFLFLKVTYVPCLIFLNTGLIISTSLNVIMVSLFLKLFTWWSLIFLSFLLQISSGDYFAFVLLCERLSVSLVLFAVSMGLIPINIGLEGDTFIV